MGTFHQVGESIECESAKIIFRKIIPVKLVRLDSVKKSFFKHECDRNSTAEILKELNPKIAIINKVEIEPLKKGSNLDSGDQIASDGITVYHESKIPLKPDIGGEGRTSTHTGQFVITKNFTYAVIKIPFQHIINALNSGKKIL